MKFAVILALVGGCLSVPIQLRVLDQASELCSQKCIPSNKFRYRPGTTYEYTYQAETQTGIHRTTDHSRLRINAKAAIEIHDSCNFVLRLKEVRLLSNENQQNRLHYAPGSREFQKLLERHPLKFTYQDGRITDICPDIGEKIWVLNLKRGFLSAFQTSMESLHSSQRLTESDITGDCDADYEIKSNGWYITKITKTKDLLKCRKREGYNTAMHTIPYSQTKVNSLPILNSSHICDQEISSYNGHLTSSVCTETHLFRPFSKDASGAMTTSTQKITYVRQHSGIHRIPATKLRKSTIHFEHSNDAGSNTAVKMREATQKLTEICELSREDVRPETPTIFSSLVYTLRDLDLTALRSLHHHIKSGGICRGDRQRTLKFFMDAIPMLGSSASVHFMSEEVSQNKVKRLQAEMWVSSLAFISHPTPEMLSSAQMLLSTRSSPATLLSVSALINNYCRKNSGICENSQEVSDLIELFKAKLGTNCNNYFQNKEEVLVTLRALGNAGNALSVVPTLNQCLTNQRLPMEVRLAAITAFRHMSCEADRNTLLSIFRNKMEDSEFRIMSYLSIMECPNAEILRQVKNTLASETVNQVGSYVWSHLSNLMETTNPHKQDIRDILDNDILKKEFDLDRRRYSRNYEASFFVDRLNTGASVEGNLIWSSKSFVPRSVSANITIDLFGHSVNLFEIGGRVEGMETLLEGIFGPKGIFKRQWSRDHNMNDKMKEIDNKFGMKKEKLMAAGYLRLFDNELRYLNLNSQSNLLDIFRMVSSKKNEREYQWNQNIMLMDSSVIIPTGVGLPLNLTVNSTASILVSIATHRGRHEISADIRPSAAVQFNTQMSVDAFVTKSGIKMVSTLHSSTRSKLSMHFGDKFSFEIETPKEKLEIIDLKTQFFLMHNNYETEQTPSPVDRREHQWCSGNKLSKITGLELCGSISLPGLTANPTEPSFPLNGPISMDLSLHNRDNLHKYLFFIESGKDRNSFRIAFDTPNTAVDRHIEFNVAVSKNKESLDMNLISPWKKVSISGGLTKLPDLRRFKGNMIVDESRQYSILAELQRDQSESSVKYLPTLEVSIHGRPAWSVKGILETEPFKKFEIDIKTDYYKNKPMGFQVKYNDDESERSLSGHVQLGKNSFYSLKSNIKLDDKGHIKVLQPSVSIKTPSRDLIDLDVTLSQNSASPSYSVKFTIDKVFKKQFNFKSEFKVTANNRRIRYATSWSLNSHWIMTRFSSYIDRRTAFKVTAGRVRLFYNIPKVSKDVITISTKLRDRSTKIYTRYYFDTNAEARNNPEKNFKFTSKLIWHRRSLLTSVDLHYGADFQNPEKKITLIESVSFLNNKQKSWLTFDLRAKYLAMDIDTQVKGSYLHTRKLLQSSSKIRINPRQVYSMNVKLENDMAQNWERRSYISASYPGRFVRFEAQTNRKSSKHYVSTVDLTWDKGKKLRTVTTVKIPTPTSYVMTSTINVASMSSAIIDADLNVNPSDFRISADMRRDQKRYGVLFTSKLPRKQYISSLQLYHPDKRFISKVDISWKNAYKSKMEMKLDTPSGTTRQFVAMSELDMRDRSNIVSSARVELDDNEMKMNFRHTVADEYNTHFDVTYAPEKVITIDTVYSRKDSWYSRVTTAGLTYSSPCRLFNKLSLKTRSVNGRKSYSNEIGFALNDFTPIKTEFTIEKPWSLTDLLKSKFVVTGAFGEISTMVHHKIRNGLFTRWQSHIRPENGKTEFIDFTVRGQKRMTHRLGEVSGDVSIKSSVEGWEDISLSMMNKKTPRTLISKAEAQFGQNGNYQYELNMNQYRAPRHFTSKGTFLLKSPIKGYRLIKSSWDHYNTDKMLKCDVKYRFGRDYLTYIVESQFEKKPRLATFSTNLNLESSASAFRNVNFDTVHKVDLDKKVLSSRMAFLRNNYKKSMYELDVSVQQNKFTSELSFLCPSVPLVSSKLTTTMSKHTQMADFELNWDNNKKLTASTTLRATLPDYLDGSINIQSPWKEISGKIRHYNDQGEWQSSAILHYSRNKFSVESTVRLSNQPKLQLDIVTPFEKLQSASLHFTHTGSFNTFATTSGKFEVIPTFGKITAQSSFEKGSQDTKISTRVNLPFENHRYFASSLTLTDDFTRKVNAQIEYKPNRFIILESEHRLWTLNDLYLTLFLTTPFHQLSFFKSKLSHNGDSRRFKSQASYEYPRQTITDLELNFNRLDTIEGSAVLRSPHQGYENMKAIINMNGDLSDFTSHASVTNNDDLLAQSDLTYKFNVHEASQRAMLEVNLDMKSPRMIEDINMWITHEGNYRDIKTKTYARYGNRDSISTITRFYKKYGHISGSTGIKSTSKYVPFKDALARFKHSGSLSSFSSEFHSHVDNHNLDVTTELRTIDGFHGKFTLDTPLRKVKDIEITLDHFPKSKPVVTHFETVFSAKVPAITKGKYVKNVFKFKFRPDKKFMISNELTTPFRNYEDLSAKVKYTKKTEIGRQEMQSHVQYASTKRISFNGHTNTIDGHETRLTLNTPFRNYKEMRLSFKSDSSMKNINSFVKYNDKDRVDVTANLNRNDWSVSVRTPFKGYEDLSTAMKIESNNMRNKVQGHVQFKTSKRIEASLDYELPNELKLHVTTPFRKYETLSVSHKYQRTDEAYTVNCDVQYMDGKKISLDIYRECPEKLDVKLTTPFQNYQNLQVVFNYLGEPRKFTLDGFIQYYRNDRIKFKTSVDSPHSGAVFITTPIPGFQTLSAAINLQRQPSLQYKYNTHVQFADDHKIESTGELIVGKTFSINLKSPFYYMRDLALDGTFSNKNDIIKTGLNIQYDTDRLVQVMADVTLPNKFEIIIKSPFEGYEKMSTSAMYTNSMGVFASKGHLEYATNQKIDFDTTIDMNNGIDSKFNLNSPFNNYEKLSASAKYSENSQKYIIGGHVQYKNGKMITTDVEADFINGVHGQLSLTTPFRDYENVRTVINIDGNMNKFNGNSYILYRDNKKIELTGKMDLMYRTEGQLKLTTPYSGFEEWSASGDFDGRPDKFRITGHIQYSPTKKVELKSVIKLNPDIDIGVYINTPYDRYEKLATRWSYKIRKNFFESLAMLQYATSQKMTGKIKINSYGNRGLFYVKTQTPFKNFEMNKVTATVNGKSSQFHLTGNLESSYLDNINLELRHSFHDFNNAHNTFTFTSNIPYIRFLKSHIHASIIDKDFIHKGFVSWQPNKVIDFSSISKYQKRWNGNMDTAHSFRMTTPFKMIRSLSNTAEYKLIKGSHIGKLTTTLNDLTVIDTSLDNNGKNINFEMNQPWPSKASVKTDVQDNSAGGEIYVNWNTLQFDSNIRLKLNCIDSSTYYINKKSCQVSATNPSHKLKYVMDHHQSRRFLKSSSEFGYNEKTYKYEINFNDQSRRGGAPKMDASLSLSSPYRGLTISGKHSGSPRSASSELNLEWNRQQRRVQKVTVISNMNKDPGRYHGDVTIQLPHLRREFGTKMDFTLNQGRTWLDGKVELHSDRDPQKTITIISSLLDRARMYSNKNLTFTVGVTHPLSRTDMQLSSHLASSSRRASGAVSLSYQLFNREPLAISTFGELDWHQKTFDVAMKLPESSIQMQGMFHKDPGYHVHLTNTYDLTKVIKTVISVHPVAKKMKISMNYDSSKPKNIIHLHAGYRGNNRFSVELWRNHDRQRVEDFTAAVTLNTSRILHTRLHWQPSLIQDLKTAVDMRLEAYNRRGSRWGWLERLSNEGYMISAEKIVQSLEMELTPVREALRQELELLQIDLDEVASQMDELYDLQSLGSFKDMITTLKRCSKEIVEVPKYLAQLTVRTSMWTYRHIWRNVLRPLMKTLRSMNVNSKVIDSVLMSIRNDLREFSNIMHGYKTYIKDGVVMSYLHGGMVPGVSNFLRDYTNDAINSMADKYTNIIYDAHSRINDRMNQLRKWRRVGRLISTIYNKGSELIDYMDVRYYITRSLIARYQHAVSLLSEGEREIRNILLNLDKSRIIVWDPENGEIQLELYLPVRVVSLRELPQLNIRRYLRNVQNSVRRYLPKYWSPWDFYYAYRPMSWNPTTWIPPFTAHAIQSGRQHFVTFDGHHYDFAGICSYVLARDFIDGDFTVIMNFSPNRWKIHKRSITVFIGHRKVDIFTNYQVMVDNSNVELPVKVDTTWVRRLGGRIIVDSPLGYQVDCDIAHDMYTVSISGWYYGKTAGLFGTYNYEPKDDFTTPQRHLVNSVAKFAHSWEVSDSCGSNRNFAYRVNYFKAPGYEACHALFQSAWSPLRYCFQQINTKPYIHKCMEDFKFKSELQPYETAICNSSALYRAKCAKIGIKISEPSQCVKCSDANGALFGLNDFKVIRTEENTVPNAADIVFVLEESRCIREHSQHLTAMAHVFNKHLKDRGIRDVRYGLVGFGGHDNEAHSHTVKGQLTNYARHFSRSIGSLSMHSEPRQADVYSAVTLAASYPFRMGVSKTVILLTCQECQASNTSFNEVSSLLQARGVKLHLLQEKKYDSQSNAVPIVAISGDDTNNECTKLAESSGGKVFDISPLLRTVLRKAVLDSIAEKVSEAAKPCACQNCNCMTGMHGTHHSVCTCCSNSTTGRIYSYIKNWNQRKSPNQSSPYKSVYITNTNM